MAVKTFSMKEAIRHGFQMTKKHFGFIFGVIVIYFLFELISGFVHNGAGKGHLSEFETRELYSDKAKRQHFYQVLQEDGLIDKSGEVKDKLQNLNRPSDMVLPTDFEPDRDKIYDFLQDYRYRLPFPKIIFYLFAIGFWFIGMLMQIGFVRISVALSRDDRPHITDLFNNIQFFIPYLLAGICYGLAVMGGFLLLIVPGIVLSLALGMYLYFIIDENSGPLVSLKKSRALTKGVRWKLFCFGWLILLVNLGGVLCLLLGLMFTIPMSSIAYAYVYDQLRKQQEEAADFIAPAI